MKRLTWFVTGLVAGAGSVVLIGRRIKRRVADLAPFRIAERALGRTRDSADRLKDAIADGRSAAARRESELRHRLLDEGSNGTGRRSRVGESHR
jgi:hypothetical protein